MTTRWRRSLIIGAGVVAVALGFMTWYRMHYSMELAHAFEVAGTGPRVLIATQGSAFKDAIVTAVVEHLKGREAQVKVIDVSALAGVNPEDWSAVVVIHTWEMRKPPAAVAAFVSRPGSRRNLVVLATSGQGDFKIEGVDTVSAASRMEDVSARSAEISAKIDAVLASGGSR